MILKDLTTIWITTHRTEIIDGETQDSYTDLRVELVNIQTMSNKLMVKTYGEITDSTIIIQTDTPPDIHKGDHIYLQAPISTGTVELEGIVYDDYPPGDYVVDSRKLSYIGGLHVKNPTTVSCSIFIK